MREPSYYSAEFFEAFGELSQKLEFAFCDSQDREGETRAISMRERYIEALIGLAHFFDVIRPDNKSRARVVSERLGELAYMVHDLSEGLEHPVLAKRPPGRREGRKVRTDIWNIRVKVVQGMDVLLRSGNYEGPEAAAIKIAEMYPELKRLLRDPKDKLGKSIVSWSTTLRGKATNEFKNKVVQDRFDLTVAETHEILGRVTDAETLQQLAFALLAGAERDAVDLIIDSQEKSGTTALLR